MTLKEWFDAGNDGNVDENGFAHLRATDASGLPTEDVKGGSDAIIFGTGVVVFYAKTSEWKSL